MREKIKLVIRPTPLEPDPPPFVCDVCGIKREHFQAIHINKKAMCWFHRDRGVKLPLDARLSMDWKDHGQLTVISSLIGELKHG